MAKEVLGQKVALFLSSIKKGANVPSPEEIDALITELELFYKEAFTGCERNEIEEAIIGVQTCKQEGTYIEEKSTKGVINAIKNYIDDERELQEELEQFEKICDEDELETKNFLAENARETRKYKRDAAHWKELREKNEKRRKKLIEGDPLFDPKLTSDPVKYQKALKTAGDPENDPFRDPDEPIVKIL
jgi:hypothetical protein